MAKVIKEKMKATLPGIVFTLLSFLFTSYIFMNTYEVVANKDIPIANSVRKMTSQDVINKVITEFEIKSDSRNINSNSTLGNLDYLEIPALGTKINLEESRKIDSMWYQRPTLAHYIGLNKDDFGNTVDYLIYSSTLWKAMPYADKIEPGTEVKMYDKNGYSAIFEVTEKTVLSNTRSFIVNKSEGRQVLLLIEEIDSSRYFGYSLITKRQQ